MQRLKMRAALAALGLAAAGAAAATPAAPPAATPAPAPASIHVARPAAPGAAPAAARAKAAAPAAQPLIDINRAGRAELKTLPGIGDAEAARIVANRPYLTKADLVLTKAVPAGVYLQIKGRIIARPQGKPRA